MKKISQLLLVLFCCSMLAAVSCSKSDNSDDGGGGGGGTADTTKLLFGDAKTQIGNGDQNFHFKGKYTIKKGVYSLKGWVYIDAGSELTIEPGTVIKGDKDTKSALIALRGGKLIAKGTATSPIVFTSAMPKGQRKPGDWGGIILCGKAKLNNLKEDEQTHTTDLKIEGGPDARYGGTDDDDNSGILSYVRCEFAGYPFQPDQEINGITFGGVGRGTQVDHLQVSYSNDDSYEWFGGSVNCKYLVAYHGWDDDFDTDYGYSGKQQFLLGVRHPKIADQSLSNGFESDNCPDGSSWEPFTSAIFSNVTIVGPIGQDASFANNTQYITGGGLNPANGSRTGIFQTAMQIRRNSRMNCYNAVAMGYPVGLIVDNDKRGTTGGSQQAASDGLFKLHNVYFAQMGVVGADINKQANGWTDQLSTNGTSVTDATKKSFSSTFFLSDTTNKSYATIAELMLNQPNSTAANPNWGPKAGSPLIGKTGLFTDAKLSDAFFTQVDYIGAFKSDADADNWMKGWTNFDPQNTDY